MNNIFKVALLQLNREENEVLAIKKGIEFCKKAKAQDADIAVFPELWNTGYELLFEGRLSDNQDVSYSQFNKWKNKAVTESSRFVTTFKNLAKELEMAIAITFLEEGSDLPYNTVMIIDSQGQTVLKYSKVHTVDYKMEAYMSSGREFQVGDLVYRNGKVKIGAMICYDRDFPESARSLMLKGAEIIVVPNACFMTKIRLEQLKVRAYENSVGIVTVNYANDGGKSSAFSPIVRKESFQELDNKVLIMGENEEIQVVDFPLHEIRDYCKRESNSYYRKPYAYHALLEETR